jgi:hypothetical protein
MTRRDFLMKGLGLGLMVGGGLLCMVTPQDVRQMAPLRLVFTTPTAPTLTWGSAFRAAPGMELPREASAYPRIICFEYPADETWTLTDQVTCDENQTPSD